MDIKEFFKIAEIINQSYIHRLVFYPVTFTSMDANSIEKAISDVEKVTQMGITGLDQLKSVLRERFGQLGVAALDKLKTVMGENASKPHSAKAVARKPSYIFCRKKDRKDGFGNCGYVLIVDGKYYLRYDHKFVRAEIMDDGRDFEENTASGVWEVISEQLAEQCAKEHYGSNYQEVELPTE